MSIDKLIEDAEQKVVGSVLEHTTQHGATRKDRSMGGAR